jgi:medium-chain acyl-[acyl-carrier-protein] hydrolase
LTSLLDANERRWIEGSKRKPRARARIVALPYAGGSSATYRHWSAHAPEDVEILAIQLPGRGSRFREPLPDSMDELVAALVPGIRRLLDRPYAIYGHSMGALIAFELCRALRKESLRAPAVLIVSGSPGPRTRAAHPTTSHQLPDERFVELLRRFNGTPPAVLESAELMRLTLPMLRSDFKISETYRYRTERPLDVPIVALAGDQDRLCPPSRAMEWQEESTHTVACHAFSGNHFFLHEHAAAVVHLILPHLA